MTYTLDKIIAVLNSKKYPIRLDDSKDFNLNIVGIRKNTKMPDTFDDLIVLFWKYNGKFTIRYFPATTDPGLHCLNQPSNQMGSAIVKEGFHKGLWKLGKHKGQYEALVQSSSVTVIRDFDRDSELDFNQPDLTKLNKKEIHSGPTVTTEWYDSSSKLVWREQTGLFGINNHRANENGKSVQVGGWSEGCQVLQNREVLHPDYASQPIKVFEFDYYMMLIHRRIQNWGDIFDYSLINEREIV